MVTRQLNIDNVGHALKVNKLLITDKESKNNNCLDALN